MRGDGSVLHRAIPPDPMLERVFPELNLIEGEGGRIAVCEVENDIGIGVGFHPPLDTFHVI